MAGSRAAQLLAEQLPKDYRVILIDRQSHFNHLYKFQRHSVVPGHSHKSFVPFTNLLDAPVLSEEQCPAPTQADQKKLQHMIVQSSILNITPSHVEVDSDLCEIEGLSEPELRLASDDDQRGKVCCCATPEGGCTGPQKRCAGTRIPYEYLVYVRHLSHFIYGSFALQLADVACMFTNRLWALTSPDLSNLTQSTSRTA